MQSPSEKFTHLVDFRRGSETIQLGLALGELESQYMYDLSPLGDEARRNICLLVRSTVKHRYPHLGLRIVAWPQLSVSPLLSALSGLCGCDSLCEPCMRELHDFCNNRDCEVLALVGS